MKNSIKAEYLRTIRKKDSDIKDHLNTLTRYANKCDTVTEFGTRDASGSTLGWLMSNKPIKVTGFDIQYYPKTEVIKELAEQEGKSLSVTIQSTLECTIEDTDILFIDTQHIYEQLKAELDRHHTKAKKYIIMHDTETFGETGDIPGHKGLNYAVDEFIKENKDWYVKEVFKHNNGLTILARRSNDTSSN